jgi:hypothetical protein
MPQNADIMPPSHRHRACLEQELSRKYLPVFVKVSLAPLGPLEKKSGYRAVSSKETTTCKRRLPHTSWSKPFL